jgi:cellulose synthase (UDP-forming)
VYLTTYGEELDLVDNTMRHMSALVWPGELNFYLLDDGDRPAAAEIAARRGIGYLARPTHEFKKAGNLRYAFDRTDGDFILILDADFAARPDLLTELVPYFDVPTVGIVQSPQYADAVSRMGWIERAAAATQELFYRFIQPSRDHAGAAICVGAGAVYRRSALAEIGGFPKIGHSEDIYTGLELARAGYRTQYVPVVVTKGLSPDNLDSFIAQQYRWCEGSMTMAWTRQFHVDPSISLPFRLSFWSGFLYYISTAFYALVAPLPAIIMIWIYPDWIRGPQILWLSGVVLLWLVVYPLVMRGKWRIEVLRLQTVYGFAHAFNIVHMLQGRLVGWVPTNNKVAPPLAISVRRFYTWYLGTGQLILLAGLSYRLATRGIDQMWGMTAFAVLNLYILAPLIWDGARVLIARRTSTPVDLIAQSTSVNA